MPEHSIRSKAARESKTERSVVSNPAAVSRRRRIAIVVVLMLCGYFLIDERKPSPDAPAYPDYVETVRDPAIEELMQDEFAPPQPSPTAAQFNAETHSPLQLPQLPQDELIVHEVAHVDHHSTTASMFAESQIVKNTQPAPQPEPQRRRRPAPRPKLRFTGEIEPLY